VAFYCRDEIPFNKIRPTYSRHTLLSVRNDGNVCFVSIDPLLEGGSVNAKATPAARTRRVSHPGRGPPATLAPLSIPAADRPPSFSLYACILSVYTLGLLTRRS
jgi:hypothetical protein